MLINQADVRKAQTLLDWQPQVDLQGGLVKLVEWYRTERDWVKDINLS